MRTAVICFAVFHVAMATVTSSYFKSYQGFEQTRYKRSTYTNDCISRCLANATCKSVVIDNGSCNMYSRSPFHYGFSQNIKGTYFSKTKHWSPIAKFSAFKDSFSGDYSYTLWNNPSSSVNTDSCAALSESSRCNRHFVHNNKDEILESTVVTKIKLSLYEGGMEAAWVIFDKQTGSDDNWFQASRVLDSYPWNTELLRNSSQMISEPQPLDTITRFSIVNKNENFVLRPFSPHRYWMKLLESIESIESSCSYGRNIEVPYILFSKSLHATLLSKSLVSNIRDGGYTLNWAEAENFCETHLNIPIASYTEVNNARVDSLYQCCVKGWMGGQISSIPMAENKPGCYGPGMMDPTSSPAERYTVYCKPNTANVGVADTMVISVNV